MALLIERIDVGVGGLNVRLSPNGLAGLGWQLKCAQGWGCSVTCREPIPDTITVQVPFRFARRGWRKEMQLPDGAAQHGKADSTLVKALARAFRWERMLESGEFTTITELAEREQLTVSFVTRVLRRTQLAPDIVEAILDGKQG